ncbi:MAG TPA: TIGR03435 family protein [Acidobacteriaceae bacterium]|jgi:uncharacterized protein (TIGR03435 family)|nr:TIGR03435 family protein [Acidobacteriaceae bacterium]
MSNGHERTNKEWRTDEVCAFNTGNYDFTLSWTAEESQTSPATNSAPMPSNSGTSIFTALREQLGLRLESTKAPVDFLVTDHVERPSEN